VSAPATIGIVGAGAWGTALALAAARAGRDVVLWGRDATAMAQTAETRRNDRYLPGVELPRAIRPSAALDDLDGLDCVLMVTPAQTLREVLGLLTPRLAARPVLVLCSKGIERASGRFLSEIVAEAAPNAIVGALSGPSFAADVARGLPTAVTLALAEETRGMALAAALGSTTFRPYWTADLRGVEIGGAMKNVFAIAAGVVAGSGLGESARAAMIARGFAELARFGRALGARPETFAGLSGLGDLVLTATSQQSRNLRFGLALGRGEAPAEALARIGTVEGAATARAADELAKRHGVEMPLTEAVARVVGGEDTVRAALERLMRRPFKAE
jgi:glycerol-3-phosphate dehydrogenase (NAD(P)+)